MNDRPLISVIVPVAPGGDVSKVLNSIPKMRYPLEKVEIIVVEGRNPSYQRNCAAKMAQGEILYFLDNDAYADKWLFRNVTDVFEEETVAVVGGPSVTPETDSLMQKSFGCALASIFGGFAAREKFLPLGLIRDASEKELILCNMAVRKDEFEKGGGFNPALYPNEENEFLNRLNAKGCRIVYHPLAIVHRSQRKNYRAFAKQIFNYGRGRFEHFRCRPEFTEPVFAVPSLFVLYLFLLPLFGGSFYYRLPLYLYLLLDAFASISLGLGAGNLAIALVTPIAFPILHISYGLGFFWGILKTVLRIAKMKDTEVVIKKVKEFDTTFASNIKK